MTIYIPDFWVGVISTILAEILFICVVATINTLRKGKKNGKGKNN